MAVYSKQLLSGGTNGKHILVAAASTLGTTVHTAVTGTSDMDEVWLWAHNSASVAGKLTIEFGAATSPNDRIEVTIPPEAGHVLVVPGFLLQNSLVVTAFAASVNVFNINGFVNRITA